MSRDSRQTVVVDGLALAQELRAEIAAQVTALVEAGGRPPCLAVVLVGDDPASASYIKGKRRACGQVGFESIERRLPASADEAAVLKVVADLNCDDSVDGILIQLPLPAGVRSYAVTSSVDPDKDVDGLHPLNAGRLLLGEPGLVPCTPLGIMEILDRHGVELEGAHAVVLGRSHIVGKPISLLLQRRNATVTMCHSKTQELAQLCREADVLVAAVGAPRLVKADWIKSGAAVVDVGVSEVAGEIVGDVDLEAALGIARLITPHRRGVGPMTITMLLHNTLLAHRRRKSA